jgi:hypothetical protein
MAAMEAAMAIGTWEVELDNDGRVVIGPAGTAEGRYLVVPLGDGSLSVLALEHRIQPLSPPAPAAVPETAPEDPEAAERELSRWGRRALGDLGPLALSRADVPHLALPLVELRPQERPQPAPIASDAPEASQATTSRIDDSLRYWLIQNRDAQALYRGRSSGRQPTP